MDYFAGPSTSKRKAPMGITKGLAVCEQAVQRGGAPSILRPPQPSKRSRRQGGPSVVGDESDDVDYVTGDIDLEEQDRKRNQQGRKGRVYTAGYDSEDSDSEDEEDDAEEEGRRKGKVAGVDEDEDMFDSKGPLSGKPRVREKNRCLELEDIEGQEFGMGRARDGANVEPLSGEEEDEDPEMELESDSDEDGEGGEGEGEEEKEKRARQRTMSPGGTTVLGQKRTKLNGKGSGKKTKPKTTDPMNDMGYKLDSFNMKNEMTSGRFDEEGNYIPNVKDPHAEHDRWLEGNYSRKAIRAAKEAKLKREQEERVREKERQREGEENGGKEGIMMRLVEYMNADETVLETLQRLGREAKPHRQSAKRSFGARTTKGKNSQVQTGEADGTTMAATVSASVKAIEDFTDLSSTLMSQYGLTDVYDEEYASLIRAVRRAGLAPSDQWDPAGERRKRKAKQEADESATTAAVRGADEDQYVYRLSSSYLDAIAHGATDGSGQQNASTAVFGPFSRSDLMTWKEQGFFGGEEAERILLRRATPTRHLEQLTDSLSDGWLTWREALT